MHKIIKYLNKKQWMLLGVVALLTFGQVFFELKMPDYMSQITILVQTEGSMMKDILINGGYMLTCAFISLILAIFTGYITSNISAEFSRDLREALFLKVEKLALNEVKHFSTSSLITRSTNDITQVQMFLAMGVVLLLKAPMTAVWAISKVLNKSWQWSVLTAIAIIILLSIVSLLMVIVLPRFKIVQKLIDQVNGVIRENLVGIRVVRAFNAEQYQENKFEQVNQRLTNQQLFNQRTFATLMPAMNIVLNALTLGIYYVGSLLISQALLTDKVILFGDMIVFSSYAMQMIMSFLMLAMIFMMYPRASVSATRILEVLEAPITIHDGDITDTPSLGTIEFKDVSFKYPDADEYVLEHVSFKANKGDTIAFIGSTGSGKSTLVNLIERFYDVSSGEIFIDGHNIKSYTQKALRSKIGYVSQKAVMFNDSVVENIFFGDNGKKRDISKLNEILQVSQAAGFVSEMDDKEQTRIAFGGTNVSGGQKQRLSIARAIAFDPEFLIFDDSFSALDYKTDATLRKALKQYTKDTTTLIVGQRIGTIMNANQIIVLDEGRVVGQGTHQELLENCQVYKEIALSQLSKEELENA